MLCASLDDLIRLNTRLVEIKNFPPREDRYGICRMIDADLRPIIGVLWRSWEHYSGNPSFPVPSTAMSPAIAYWQCKRWSKRSQYGQMRFKLLDYLIEQTELKIKELM